jgi:hypothetical protein
MFSKGKLTITVSKTIYSPGEIVSGNISLTLKKPVKGRELSVSLIGEKGSHQAGTVTFGKSSSSQGVVRVYDFQQRLDTEKEYSLLGEYQFKIKIPGDILDKPAVPELDGAAAQGLKFVQAAAQMLGAIPTPTRWYLLAKLDIPGAPDINDRIDISIG